MKVLFVARGNSTGNEAKIVVQNQFNSLKNNLLNLELFLIRKGGLKGYFSEIPRLRKYIRDHKIDLVHSHYSTTAILVTIALLFSRKKHLVSLMGSDANFKGWKRIFLRFLSSFFWNETIVKSDEMREKLGLSKCHVIPNGVDLDRFKPTLNQLQTDCKTILFPADPSRTSKNFELTKTAFDLLNNKSNYKLVTIYNQVQEKVIEAIQQADCVVVSSRWEGSPNVVKETMAIGTPIVATKVGDIPWLLDKVNGAFLSEQNALDLSEKIASALQFKTENKSTNGREKLIELELDDRSVAQKIIQLYTSTYGK
ncbi:MAG: hypothetical protein RL264_2868 [Bacteroidota bacterium]|jgi:glycosyltransferase involved in cell wall biosynthesis